jgi:hypothetical protein
MERALPLLAGALTAAVNAAVVQGVVLENQTGYPMARALVALRAIGPAGVTAFASQQSGRGGQFSFLNVPPGDFILVASREGYHPVAHGQRKPDGQGIPFTLSKDSNFFTELRLMRLAAISGRVLDENRVGLSDIGVVAYTASLPLRVERSVKSDDRGVYRLWGLKPGRYWVRTAPGRLGDGLGTGLLPTFAPGLVELKDARLVEVRPDAEVPDVDVTPEQGNLFRLSGAVTCPTDKPVTVRVTVSSDTGRRETNATCNGSYAFDGLAPAYYELFAAAADSGGAAEFSAHMELFLDRNSVAGTLQLRPAPEMRLDVRIGDASAPPRFPLRIRLRRIDLAGATRSG